MYPTIYIGTSLPKWEYDILQSHGLHLAYHSSISNIYNIKMGFDEFSGRSLYQLTKNHSVE